MTRRRPSFAILLPVAGALMLGGAVLRFLTLYALDALLAVFGVGRPQPFPQRSA